MKKTIYHGSDHIIEKPQYGYGKPYNDYGVGFYCTENPNMAKEWGVSIDHNGYANEYQIECDGLTILDLNAHRWRRKLRIISYRIFIWTTKWQMSLSAIVPMTATFPLPLTLSTVQSRIASCVALCALANWVSNLY